MTAIGAAVRSLEYREVLISAPAGITLTSGLLQTWLVENARLGGASAEAASAPVSRRWIGLAILVVVLLVIGVLLAINASRPRTGEHLPDATITLVGATPSP
jgi:branched-subunit amino acid permease